MLGNKHIYISIKIIKCANIFFLLQKGQIKHDFVESTDSSVGRVSDS